MRIKSIVSRVITVIFAGMLLFIVGMIVDAAVPRNMVWFSLAIAGRPVSDVSSYQALLLHGPGFDFYKSASQEKVLYEWFARALYENKLPLALTYGGYAQSLMRSGSVSHSDLKAKATELVLAEQYWEHDNEEKGSSRRCLTGEACSGRLTNGAPYPWMLPKLKGKCYSKVVWDAAYWDLVSASGTENEKRGILAVEAEYEWGHRLECCGHGPSIGMEKTQTGFRLLFRDGMGGLVFARLHVKFPGSILSEEWFCDKAAYYFYDPVLRFVFAALKKPENHGRTISGKFRWKSPNGEVYVDGQEKPVVSVEADDFIRPTKDAIVDLRNVEDVQDCAYAKQSELCKVEFSSKLKRIGKCAFLECEKLAKGRGTMKLPVGLESIEDGAFEGCENLASVALPDTVTNLGCWVFADCSTLRSVVLPQGLKEIPDGLFYKCRRNGEKGDVTIPNTVTRIGRYAFARNTRLMAVELPNGVVEIDDYAFYGCKSLTNVVIRGDLKRIGEGAFWGCEKLKRPVSLPSTELGENAFGSWNR